MYLDYDKLKKMIEDFKADSSMVKLPGLYTFAEVDNFIKFYTFKVNQDCLITHECDQFVSKKNLACFSFI